MKLILTNDTIKEINCFVNKHSRILVWLTLCVELEVYHILLFHGFVRIDLDFCFLSYVLYLLFQRQPIGRPGYSVVLLFQSWRGRLSIPIFKIVFLEIQVSS